ncbi:MAG: RDD family protein [Malacoplasma sp.]
MENDIKHKIISRFNLAKASQRFFARLFDFIFLGLIIVGLFFAIFNTSKIQGWQMFVFSIVVFICLGIYFIIIPFVTNGYTLFKKVFKIKTHNILLNNISRWKPKLLKGKDFIFLFFLFKKELLIWFIWSIVFIVFGIICLTMKDKAHDFIIDFISAKSASVWSAKIYSGVFVTIFSILFVLDAFLLINLFMTSGKRCFNDNISNTIVIKMVDVNSSDSNSNLNKAVQKTANIKYKLPGEISSTLIDEI